jgi:hypothetical protein
MPIHNTPLKGDVKVPTLMPFDVNARKRFVGLNDGAKGWGQEVARIMSPRLQKHLS